MLLFLHNNKSHILNVSRTELVLVSLLIEWVLCFVATSEMSSFKINVVVLSVFGVCGSQGWGSHMSKFRSRFGQDITSHC